MDVASIYGVETRIVNQAVKNNPKKFPNGYVFTIDDKEKEEVKNFDHLAKSKFSNVNPKAFTEAEASSLISSAITLRQAKPNRSLS